MAAERLAAELPRLLLARATAMSLEVLRWRLRQLRGGGSSLTRRLAQLLLGFRHRSDYGTQEGVDSFRRLEYRCNVRFEDNGYNTLRHLFSKAIRLGSAVIEAILLAHRVA